MQQNRDCSYEPDDAALVTSVLAGEREAFDLLLQRYSASALRLCSRLLGNTSEAQDIVQETALQAFLGLSRLRDPARFGAWFHAIAANLARSALRRGQERLLVQSGEEAMDHQLQIEASATFEDRQREQEIHEAILQALQELAPATRAAVAGFYLHGYHYEELAQLLDVPISTLKWRLFTGRKQLKTLLQPLAEALLSSGERTHRKETPMQTGDLVPLRIDSLRSLRLTRQFLVILRDMDSARGLPVALTPDEFNALDSAIRTRQNAPELSLPQDLGTRLLESFEAHLEQIVINALAGQTLYATATIRQGAHSHEVDMRLPEALVLAVRADAPISIKRALLATAATLELTRTGDSTSEEVWPAGEKELPGPEHGERLQQEKAIRPQAAAWRTRPEQSWERLWSVLLVSLTGSSDTISASELRTLDPVSVFPTREVIWDDQPMTAIQLPGQLEPGWLLVLPELWEMVRWQWQFLRASGQEKEATPLAANSVPDTFTPLQQSQVAELVARLAALPGVRSAFLLDPAGSVATWQGLDPPDATPRPRDASSHLSRHTSLANEPELRRQFGRQWQEISAVLPPDQPTSTPGHPITGGSGRLHALHPSGWQLVVSFEEKIASDLMKKTGQQIAPIWQELMEVLTQQRPH